MKSGEVDFKFPVLGFSPDNDVWGFADREALTTCGPRTLAEDMQSELQLVDADGRRWIVRSVRRIGRAGSLLSRLLSGALWRIEHELEALPDFSLAEVQAKVCAAMEVHPEFWCEDDERKTVLPARMAEVRASRSIADIHQILGLDDFRGY